MRQKNGESMGASSANEAAGKRGQMRTEYGCKYKCGRRYAARGSGEAASRARLRLCQKTVSTAQREARLVGVFECLRPSQKAVPTTGRGAWGMGWYVAVTAALEDDVDSAAGAA